MLEQKYTRNDYKGLKSTLCAGCGHDSISNHIISSLFKLGIHPYDVAKVSGIGCSSKSLAYFSSKSHGFNALHGRMAPVATGAKLANKKLTILGVSGDGDTASIGMGGFTHLIRRNLPMLYIIENNGVYGLTKGQFSATADQDSTLKIGTKNPYMAMDLCTLSITLGATFVARSFSGDAKQLVPLISAGLRHKGTAVIDIISPCVTFNDHEGSTKSYAKMKDCEHRVNLQDMGFIPAQEEKTAEYEPGSSVQVTLHDGSILDLRKIAEGEHKINDSASAIQIIEAYKAKNQLLTGLFYLNQQEKSLEDTLNLCDKSLATLDENDCRPEKGTLKKILADFQ